MAHSSLVPINDVYLSTDEVSRRLSEEFLFVELDRELGKQEYDRGLEHLRSLVSQELSPGGRDVKQELQIAEARRNKAVYIFMADSPESGDAYLSTTLVPEEPIFFGYCSQSHQDASEPLLRRVEKALGYHEDE